MQDTYTFIARSAVDPSRVLTVTLHDHHMTVGSGPALEQALQGEIAEAQGEQSPIQRLWLRPLALSLLQRGSGPFPVADVFAGSDGDHFSLKAWFRAGGLRLLPVTLIQGPVDNPDSAEAFVEELRARKSYAELRFGVLEIFEYWITWIMAFMAVFGFLQLWRRRRSDQTAA